LIRDIDIGWIKQYGSILLRAMNTAVINRFHRRVRLVWSNRWSSENVPFFSRFTNKSLKCERKLVTETELKTK
jgi:hypothetical protein